MVVYFVSSLSYTLATQGKSTTPLYPSTWWRNS